MDSEHPEFGQDSCINCGFRGRLNVEIAEVEFNSDGDALCPECGEICDYFDFREYVECAQCNVPTLLSKMVRAYGNADDLFCDDGCAESWSDRSPD